MNDNMSMDQSVLVNQTEPTVTKKRKPRKNRSKETSKQRRERDKLSRNKKSGDVINSKFPQTLGLDLTLEVRQRLVTLLKNIESGSNVVHMTPLCAEYGQSKVMDILDEVFKNNRSKMNNVLIDIETNQRTKIGPRSIAVPWADRKEAIISNFNRHDRDYEAVVIDPPRNVKNSLNPISISSARDELKNTTSAGLPYLTKKDKVKDTVINEFSNLINRQDPCVLYTRTQESKKTRAVWGFPIADTLLEMMYYKPLLNFQKNEYWRAALLTYDILDERISEMFQVNNKDFGIFSFVSIDFSAYDASISPSLQKAAFEYIKKMYNPKEHDMIDYINHRFTNIGLVTPDGVFNGPHGVPSGSVFTNEVDSIVQYLIANESDCMHDKFQIQGDDGVYLVPTKLVDRFIREFEDAGLTVNRDKTNIDRDYCTYLQNLYHRDYIGNDGIVHGIYPIYRALNRLLYQERFANLKEMDISGKDYYSIRTISILEGCKYHPLFKDFVTMIYKLDKYNLNPTLDGIHKFSKVRLDAEGQEGIIVSKPGDVSTGINNFETVKLLRKLRLKDSKFVKNLEGKYSNKVWKMFNMINKHILSDKAIFSASDFKDDFIEQ